MVEERKKEKSQGFAVLGIPVGAILSYKKDPDITVKTLNDKNKVEYQGKGYSISTLAKQLVGSPVSGYLYFKYNGVVLKNLASGAPAAPASAPALPEGVRAPSVPPPVPASADPGNEDLEEDIDPLAGVSGEELADAPEMAGNEEV